MTISEILDDFVDWCCNLCISLRIFFIFYFLLGYLDTILGMNLLMRFEILICLWQYAPDLEAVCDNEIY